MILDFLLNRRSIARFKSYRPQPVTAQSLSTWLSQFPHDRALLLKLLRQIKFLDEATVKSALLKRNEVLLDALAGDGLLPKNVIYVQIDDAGSSSPVMLNLLRDAGQLKQRGCKFCDSHDVETFNKLTAEVAEGAIIYVDDFVGSGKQMCATRDAIAPYIIGNFSEHVLAAVICEESYLKFGVRGIKPEAPYLHSKAERPLNRASTVFNREERERLREMSLQIAADNALGFDEMASMYVLYRDAPNNIPRLLRGSKGQRPFVGIFPRSEDLPITPAY